MQSSGFAVLYVSYESVVRAFATVGIDAKFDEETANAVVAAKIKSWNSLPDSRKDRVTKALISDNMAQIKEFIEQLRVSVERDIEKIVICPLHGAARELRTVAEAICFVERYKEDDPITAFQKYEISIRFKNGSCIDGLFVSRREAMEFLRIYSPR